MWKESTWMHFVVFYDTLGKYSSHSYLRSIHLHYEGQLRIWDSKYWCRGESVFQSAESLFSLFCPLESLNILPSESREWSSNCTEISNEPSIEIGKAKKTLYLLGGGGPRAVSNCLGLCRVHLDMTFWYNETQKGNLLNMKLTLLQFWRRDSFLGAAWGLGEHAARVPGGSWKR